MGGKEQKRDRKAEDRPVCTARGAELRDIVTAHGARSFNVTICQHRPLHDAATENSVGRESRVHHGTRGSVKDKQVLTGTGTPSTTGFDPSKVPYPSKSEIQDSWGGWRNFMESYGLKVWNNDNVQEANAIVKAMQDAEYEQRVAHAREEFEKRALAEF